MERVQRSGIDHGKQTKFLMWLRWIAYFNQGYLVLLWWLWVASATCQECTPLGRKYQLPMTLIHFHFIEYFKQWLNVKVFPIRIQPYKSNSLALESLAQAPCLVIFRKHAKSRSENLLCVKTHNQFIYMRLW